MSLVKLDIFLFLGWILHDSFQHKLTFWLKQQYFVQVSYKHNTYRVIKGLSGDVAEARSSKSTLASEDCQIAIW